jgi:hypothetical protein
MALMIRSYQMLGKAIRVTLDDSVAGRVLGQELALYPQAPDDQTPAFEIRYGPLEEVGAGLVNPATHHDLADGFAARFGGTTVRWVIDDKKLKRVDFYIRPAMVTGLRLGTQRMRSSQFTLPDEAVGQVFHELVLIPSVYFDETRFLVHSAGLQSPDGAVTLIGGTGGVGKTSLGLELCRHHGFRFVTDDIAVVDETGHVWPNLAFPKVYGYNVDGDDDLRRLILDGTSWANRVSWRIHRTRGADRVRRRVSPADLYTAYSDRGGRLKRYLFLAREVRNDIVVQSASAASLASLSTDIMDAEYHAFHSHLSWHSMNRRLRDATPLITRDAVLRRWRNLASTVLRGAECMIVRVPRAMDHRRFKAVLSELILEKRAAA